MYTNADNGILNKKAELRQRILKHKPHIIAITEIKPKKHKSLNKPEYAVKGYDLFINDNPKRGTALYIHENLKAREVNFKNSENYDENVWCSFVSSNQQNVLLGCIYRSPNSGTRITTTSLNYLVAMN